MKDISYFLLRLSVGWMMFYAGITKVLNPEWSAGGYLSGAKTLPGLFNWFAQPGILPVVDLANEWGLTLLGVSLILGVLVRWSAPLGALLMLLYYVPILDFPYPNTHSFIVDEHIIYIFALLFFASYSAGKWGLDGWLSKMMHSKSSKASPEAIAEQNLPMVEKDHTIDEELQKKINEPDIKSMPPQQ